MAVDREQNDTLAQERSSKQHDRPPPEHRISLTLAVVDPQALWDAAAGALIAAPDLTIEDVLDVIGPREDPAIVNCINAIAKPVSLAGCVLDDFWIDTLDGRHPRIDSAGSLLEHRMTVLEPSPRRSAQRRRQTQHLALCMLPPLRN